MAYVLSYTLIVAALIGHLLIKSIQTAEVAPNFSCASNEIAIVVKNIAEAPYINLATNVKKFRKHILNSILENKKPFLNILEPHLLKATPILGMVYNEKSDKTPYILAPLDLFSEPHKWVGLCAIEIPEAKNYILQIKSFGALSEK